MELIDLNSKGDTPFHLTAFDGTDVYILYCNYQVKPHLFTWFSAAGAIAVVYRTTSFLYTSFFPL